MKKKTFELTTAGVHEYFLTSRRRQASKHEVWVLVFYYLDIYQTINVAEFIDNIEDKYRRFKISESSVYSVIVALDKQGLITYAKSGTGTKHGRHKTYSKLTKYGEKIKPEMLGLWRTLDNEMDWLNGTVS